MPSKYIARDCAKRSKQKYRLRPTAYWVSAACGVEAPESPAKAMLAIPLFSKMIFAPLGGRPLTAFVHNIHGPLAHFTNQ